MAALWFLLRRVDFCVFFVCVCVCLCARLSTSRDQLMVADDGAGRGQGSKPCIVSLALLSQRASPPPSPLFLPLLLLLHPLGDPHPPLLTHPPTPHPSCCLLHIYIHLSTACVAVAVVAAAAAARRAAACSARISAAPRTLQSVCPLQSQASPRRVQAFYAHAQTSMLASCINI